MQMLEKLQEMIAEIRRIRRVKPGDQSAPNEDFGEMGQLLECLIYDEANSWEEVEQDSSRLERVVATTECYLQWLREHPQES